MPTNNESSATENPPKKRVRFVESIKEDPKIHERGGNSVSQNISEVESDDEDKFVESSNNAIEFKLIDRKEQLVLNFRPKFSHQLFEDELIKGYRGLKITVLLTLSLDCHIKLGYDEMKKPDAVQNSSDPNKLIHSSSSPSDGSCAASETFLSPLDLEKRVAEFTPTEPVDSNKFHELATIATTSSFLDVPVIRWSKDGRFAVTQTNLCDAAQRGFADRLQSFAFFFIDGASWVDLEDEAWQWATLWTRANNDSSADEKLKSAKDDSESKTLKDCGGDWIPAGYMTIYSFTNPIHARTRCPRVCQVLILPPFQRQGLGSLLYRTAFDGPFGGAKEAWEVTVESPCPAFARLRNAIDLQRFQGYIDRHHSDHVKWTPALAEEVRNKLRLPKKQSKLCFDMYQFNKANGDDAKTRAFRLSIKRRLYASAVKHVENEHGLKGEHAAPIIKQVLAHLYQDMETNFRIDCAAAQRQRFLIEGKKSRLD